MHDQHQTNHPPDELTQGFWQAWREQVGKSPRLRHLLLQRSRQLLERLQHFYDMLSKLSLAGQQRWQRKLGTSLAGVALALALSNAPVAYAFPISVEANINGTDCLLVDAVIAANTDTATGDCAAGNPGADTITLLGDMTLDAVNNIGTHGDNNGLPVITSVITIEGGGYTIARDGAAPDFRILDVSASGSLTLNDTTISGGFSPRIGGLHPGGINIERGSVTLNNSTVSGNSSIFVGGIYNHHGNLTLNNSTVSGNSGAGIVTQSTGYGSNTVLINSTVSGNSDIGVKVADYGDVDYNYGGSSFGSASATLTNITITGNSIGLVVGTNGLYGTSKATVEHSLIAGNNSFEVFRSTGGTITGNNFNLFGYGGSARSLNFTPSGSDIVPSQAFAGILGPLADNGGGTNTHALAACSPAIDAAPSGPATDQRGVARPQGLAFDIGAYEGGSCVSNVAPTAVDDSVTTNEDTPVTFDVLANDSDVDGNLDPTTVSVVSGPTNGVLTDNGNGSFTYTPTPDFFGSDSFTYQVCDSDGACATATVTISVSPVNDAPIAVDDSYTTDENTPISISPLDNDSAGPTNEDQTLTFMETTSPQNGIILSFPGGMQYVPNPGFSGSDSFTYTACDSNGACATATVYITVNAVNVAPIANAGANQSVFRNDVVNVSGTWTDPQGAGDNPYTWSWDLDGDAIADDSGSANYGDTIPGSTSFAVDGVATLTFSVTDKNGATSSDTVDITVVNRAPTANGQTLSVDEDGSLAITLSGGDADNDPLTYSVLTLPTNGALSGTAPNLTYTPNPDYFGPDSFTFQVNDGLADSNIATVAITVNSVNDPAVAVNDSATTNEDTAVNIPVQGNDSAGPTNENQTLTTTAVTDPPNGSAVINPDGSITYTPDANFNGSDTFDYTVCDADGSCATATVTVLVNMVNDPPVANDDSVTTPEDTAATFDVLANDSDVDGNLNPGSVTVVSAPVNGTLTANGNGSFTYTPDANFNGVDSFTYQVCDGENVCASATVNIIVSAVNDAPVCTNVTPSVTVLWPPNHQWEPVTVSGVTDLEGDAITISVSSIFQDEPTNGTGDGDTSPDGQGIGSSTAQVRAERKGNGNGRFYTIGVTASDGNGGSCSTTVKVSVPKNQGKNGAAVDDGALYDSTQP